METAIFGHRIVGVHRRGESLELKLPKARVMMFSEGRVNAYIPL
jgi:hypothetical protein